MEGVATMKDSLLILLRAKLEELLPFDFSWITVVAEELEAFRRNFSWSRLGERLFWLALSLTLLWWSWSLFAPIRQALMGITIALAKLEVNIALMFLPFTLFFGAFELFAVVTRFLRKPTKRRFRIAWHSLWVYALLAGIYWAHTRYHEQIEAYLHT